MFGESWTYTDWLVTPPHIEACIKFIIIFSTLCSNEFRVVGFEVEARSVDVSQLKFDGTTCILPTHANLQFVNAKGTKLLFLYSVEWRESEVSWASRWDIYLGMSDVEIHWFSIVNSLIVVLFLSGKYVYIYVCTLYIVPYGFTHSNRFKSYEQQFLIKLCRDSDNDHGSNSKKGYRTLQCW